MADIGDILSQLSLLLLSIEKELISMESIVIGVINAGFLIQGFFIYFD